MVSSLTANDILSDIEFELVQAAISRNDLGQSIRAVKQYQNKIRHEVFESMRPGAANREIISRQFQIGDMLITLLQEMAATIRAMELDQRKVKRILPAIQPTNSPLLEPTDGDVNEHAPLELSDAGLNGRRRDEIENAMRPEAIQIDLQVRPIRLPIIGWLVTLLQIFQHRPPLFYVQRFANKQAPVNRTFGDWILQLDQVIQNQQEQLRALSAQLEHLEDRVLQMESASRTSDGSNQNRN